MTLDGVPGERVLGTELAAAERSGTTSAVDAASAGGAPVVDLVPELGIAMGHRGYATTMADPVSPGNVVPAGSYRCTNCGYLLELDVGGELMPCPACGSGAWVINVDQSDQDSGAE
jgi:rubrerythrin